MKENKKTEINNKMKRKVNRKKAIKLIALSV